MATARGGWPAPDFSLAAAYPDVAWAANTLHRGDWAFARQAWHSFDWMGRTLLVDAACDVERIELPFFEELAREFPGDTVVDTFLGAMLVTVGGPISPDAVAGEVEHLRRAERILIDVTARDPGNAVAWTQRQRSARGLGLDESEARRRYDRLSRHVPGFVEAQTQLLRKLCPKWGGTWERAHAFARECMTGAPDGADNALVVLEAHLEHWADLPAGEAGAYVMSEPVVAEVREAAERSIWHPAYERTYGWVKLENAFAALFAMTGDHRSALRQYDRIGPVACEAIWSRFDDPAGAFVAYRNEAAEKGGEP